MTSNVAPVLTFAKCTVAVSHGAGVTPCCMTRNPISMGVPARGVAVCPSATMSAQPPAITGTTRMSSIAIAATMAAILRIIDDSLRRAGGRRRSLLPIYTEGAPPVPGATSGS
jgi:hypothetical protein